MRKILIILLVSFLGFFKQNTASDKRQKIWDSLSEGQKKH